ncbi:MAG: SDR family NAD(P)-dependent oxidoreductase [bacterium]
MNLKGNTVLITGGSMGIGLELAKEFLNLGNEVIICGRRKDRLEEVVKKNPDLKIIVCDVSNQKSRKELFDWTCSNFKNLNILINNAGVQRDIDFTNGIDEYLSGDNEILINFEAPVVLSGLFIPFLKDKKNSAIVNITSGLGFVPSAKMPVYGATKAGLHAFSMALRYQLSKTNIKIFEAIPPALETELNKEGRAKRGQFSFEFSVPGFISTLMDALQNDIYEIGYGYSEKFRTASREELDKSFQVMNSKM